LTEWLNLFYLTAKLIMRRFFILFPGEHGCVWASRPHRNTAAVFSVAILTWLVSVAGLHAAQTVTIGTLAPEGTSYHRSLLEMREKWAKAPGGGVRLRIYAGGKLGGDAKMVSQMRLGALDAGMLTSAGLAEIEPAATGLQGVPMMYRSLAELDHVTTKLKDLLEERLEKQGFVALSWSDVGWVHFFSKTPVHTPEDVKKTKIFTWAGEPALVEIWKSAGFQPVPLETADIVPMLDSGLINCVPMPPFVALGAQVYDRAPHMLQLNWAPLVGAVVIRKQVWDRIPQEAKPALRAAAEEAGRGNKALGRAESDKAIAAMKEKGLKVYPVDAALEAQWRTEAERFYSKIRGSYVPADIFDRVQATLKEYRAAGGKQ
jgi:TRAP-type C4-dicarboxylate transport system substrate-binding protein